MTAFAAAVLAVSLAADPGVEVAHRRVVAEDGAALALYRYQRAQSRKDGRAVLLVADAGFGRSLFDLYGHGLARWLAARGRRVFVAELRGQGASSGGSSMRSWVHLDFPAIARALAEEAPGPFDVVAHGWTGSLVLAAAGRELNVRRVVALNTPMHAEVPSALAETFLKAGGAFSQLAASAEGARQFDLLFAMDSKFPGRVLESLRVIGVRDLPAPIAAEWLAWMRTGDLVLDDGTSVVSRLRAYDRPTLLFLALGDGFAGPELCSPLRDETKAQVRLRTLSRFELGDDFSHVGLLLGAGAPSAVFPEIERFFAEGGE